MSQEGFDLDGHAEDGSYVIISCRGTYTQFSGFVEALKTRMPSLAIDEKNKAALYDYRVKGLLWAFALAGVFAVGSWLYNALSQLLT